MIPRFKTTREQRPVPQQYLPGAGMEPVWFLLGTAPRSRVARSRAPFAAPLGSVKVTRTSIRWSRLLARSLEVGSMKKSTTKSATMFVNLPLFVLLTFPIFVQTCLVCLITRLAGLASTARGRISIGPCVQVRVRFTVKMARACPIREIAKTSGSVPPMSPMNVSTDDVQDPPYSACITP